MQAVAFRSQGVGSLAEAQERLVRSVDVKDKHVVDLGGYDGAMAAIADEMGAWKATVVDSGEWREYGWPEPARRSRVIYKTGQLNGPETSTEWEWDGGGIDVIYAFNILYHLEDPIGGLRKLRELTLERLLLCTSFVQGPENYWRLYDESDPTERIPEGATRYTNYFKPTISGLYRALKRVGFTVEPGAFTVGDHVLLVAS